MSARVYGVVTNANTGVAIPGSTVVAPPYTVFNNGQGSYYFLTPGAAVVDVTASATGFTPQTKQVTVANGALKNLPFALVPV